MEKIVDGISSLSGALAANVTGPFRSELGFLLTCGVIGALAVAFAGYILYITRPVYIPRNGDLREGVHRAEGDGYWERFKAAKRLFSTASFQMPGKKDVYAARGRRVYRFGPRGITPKKLDLLRCAVLGADNESLDALLFLLRELPGESDQPAVVAVRGCKRIRAIRINDENEIVIPGLETVIPASQVAAFVGYAFPTDRLVMAEPSGF